MFESSFVFLFKRLFDKIEIAEQKSEISELTKMYQLYGWKRAFIARNRDDFVKRQELLAICQLKAQPYSQT